MMQLPGISSDSEVPSPLPSPIFARCSPARGTVARKCREFYLKRLERTASMQKRWSICDMPEEFGSEPSLEPGLEPETSVSTPAKEDDTKSSRCEDTFKGYPLRKCRSSFDLAMDSLRKEISSLIAQDNDLFRQLLSLHDSIAELRERQRHSACLDDDDDDEEEDEDIDIPRRHHRDIRSNCLSLESLSDPGSELPETSPESTLSSRSSLSANSSDFNKPCKHHAYSHHRNRYRKDDVTKQRHRMSTDGNDSRPIVFIDKSEICFRCKKMAPPYRRSSSITSLYYLHEDMESYDSGIHLQGSHSDSDHEIFV